MEDLSNPIHIPTKTLDPSAQSKHAGMLERLSNLHQSRLQQQSLSREPNSNPNPDSFESTQSFLSRFNHSKNSIDSDLARLRQSTTDSHSSNPSSKSDLHKVSASISDLEKLVAESSYFLPSYDVRVCLETISDLKQTLENVSSEVVPKKRFAFKNKQTKKAATSVVVSEPELGTQETERKKPSFEVRDLPGFRGKQNEVLVKEFKGSEIGEFTLSDLSGCEVRLTGCLRALFVHKLKDCRVYVGPVLGSVLIEEVEGCVFVLASHQIRTHHARGCDFYLRVRSRPIIEDSSGVRFAPYCLCYDGIETDLKESNLYEEMGNWANVDDFRWLRAVQSPNWLILPESERLGTLNISNPET
ncbi:tubulin-folding cofactor C [Cornus florida]|uniref:tubulin-folding cofactor C n=1 Tax=Cornus florida TaxID=4283 RepID=UPI00289C60E3|nr:tubulin-folding cofactor C [Cornus florida]